MTRQILKKLKIFLFADDTNICLESDNLEALETDMNKELNVLYDWLCVNRLSLNISKTNFVLFHSINKPKISISIKINNTEVEEKPFVKYLLLALLISERTVAYCDLKV